MITIETVNPAAVPSAPWCDSHQAGVGRAQWHPELLLLRQVNTPAHCHGHCWHTDLANRLKMGISLLELTASRALTINLVQLASHPYSYSRRNFNVFPAAGWLKIVPCFSQQVKGHSSVSGSNSHLLPQTTLGTGLVHFLSRQNV